MYQRFSAIRLLPVGAYLVALFCMLALEHVQDTQILDLLGGMLKLQVEKDKLEFLVDRLCLPMNFVMAFTLFEVAKIEMLSAFLEEIAKIEEEVANPDGLLPFTTHEGKLDALSAFLIKVADIEEEVASTDELLPFTTHKGKLDALSAFIIKVAIIEEEVVNANELVAFTHKGKLDALSAFINEVAKIEALSAFTKVVKHRRPRQERPISAAFEQCVLHALVVTEVPMTPMTTLTRRARHLHDRRLSRENERRRPRLNGSASSRLR
jgi:hypothetical protein